MTLLQRARRLPGQVLRRNPFGGSLRVEPLPFWATVRMTAKNFRTSLRIIDWVFRDGGDLKYIDVPGFPPILFIRHPDLIREITVETAHKGDFERDTMPMEGIGRVVGTQNLLYATGENWHAHKTAVARPLGPASVKTPEVFHDLEQSLRRSVEPELQTLADELRRSGVPTRRMQLEPSIKALMLTVLVNVLFGCPVPHAEIQSRYLPAIERVIDFILLDAVANPLHLPVLRLPTLSRRHGRVKDDRRVFEELVERVFAARTAGTGFWPLLTAAGADEAIKSNIRVFLAGALEATTSLICWTLSNLARDPAAQARAYEEAMRTDDLTPQSRERATYLAMVINESLRLNNALYFLPRIALRPTTVTVPQGTLTIPARTHMILATYHMNRCEKYWGVEATGYVATAFAPQRWEPANLAAHGRTPRDMLHFGFGHGPRVCVGKHFGEAEAYVCVTLFLRRFEFRAVHATTEAESGVSSRPRDKVEVDLSLRF